MLTASLCWLLQARSCTACFSVRYLCLAGKPLWYQPVGRLVVFIPQVSCLTCLDLGQHAVGCGMPCPACCDQHAVLSMLCQANLGRQPAPFAAAFHGRLTALQLLCWEGSLSRRVSPSLVLCSTRPCGWHLVMLLITLAHLKLAGLPGVGSCAAAQPLPRSMLHMPCCSACLVLAGFVSCLF